MFGYITTNQPEMKVKDLELYRSYYCGLCDELFRRYGRHGQILLSYDCTFLLVLLTGMYEPEESTRLKRCLLHPAVKHRETKNRFCSYAADMNVLLSYCKAVDDWQDERSEKARLLALLLHNDYLKIRERFPRQEEAVSRNIKALRREERSSSAKTAGDDLLMIDRVSAYTGRFLGELCAPYEDIWTRDLKAVGFYLGKFLYLMDAYDDLEKDREKGNYNVLLQLYEEDPENFAAKVKELLLDMAACCCKAFERLPIVKNVDILRNVLYSGIWLKFHQVTERREQGGKKKPAAQRRI